jgi:hypothetical protein
MRTIRQSKIGYSVLKTSIVALIFLGGDKQETRCLGIWLRYPVPEGFKYGDLTFHVGGI